MSDTLEDDVAALEADAVNGIGGAPMSDEAVASDEAGIRRCGEGAAEDNASSSRRDPHPVVTCTIASMAVASFTQRPGPRGGLAVGSVMAAI